MDTKLMMVVIAGIVGASLSLYFGYVKPDRSPLEKTLHWPLIYLMFAALLAASLVFGFLWYEKGSEWGQESGRFEWLTFWFAAAGAVFLAIVVWRSRKSRLNILALGLCALAIFFAGEEIAWGQHLFQFEAPGFFAENNSQDEVTVHNLRVGGVYFGGYAQALMPIVLITMFLIAQRLFPDLVRSSAGVLLDRRAAILALIFGVVFALSAFPFGGRVEASIPVSELPVALFSRHSTPFGECMECLFGYYLMLAGIVLYHRLPARSEQAQVAADTAVALS